MLTQGTKGDILPFLLLGQQLVKKGHKVTLCSSPDVLEGVDGQGVDLCPVGPSTETYRRLGDEWMAKGDFRRMSSITGEIRKALMESMAKESYEAAAGSDLIIFKYLWVAGYSIAEKLGVPSVGVMLFPVTHTREFPCFHIGDGKYRGRLHNALLWWFDEQSILWKPQRAAANRLRTDILQLKPFPSSGPYKRWHRRKAREGVPLLYLYSPAVLPKPADWPDHFHVVGACKNLPPDDWAPPEELVRFLQGGDPPVYIGFGSAANDAERNFGVIIEALEISGMRGVIHQGHNGIGVGKAVPESVIVIEDIPHSWLFPQTAAVVHHGGAGTTMAGVQSGVPSIIVPFVIDQYSWGERIYALGVGPRPIPIKELDAKRLATAITEATQDERMRRRAAEMGRVLAEEDGIQAAVEFVEALVGTAKGTDKDAPRDGASDGAAMSEAAIIVD
jgi:UDP:flavonoid glycosyltransferase YjiC (YdhE family)